MGIRVEILTEPLRNDVWDSFVIQHQGSIFHLSSWSKILYETYKFRPVYLELLERGEIIGILPLFLVRTVYGRLMCVPFLDYCDPLFKIGLGLKARKRAIEVATKVIRDLMDFHGVRLVEIRTLADGLSTHFLTLAGFIEDKRYKFITSLIDLHRPPEEILMRLHSSARRAIRKAERSGVYVREVGGETGLRMFYRLYVMGMKRHGTPPHGLDFFRRVLREFGRHVRIYVAFVEGVPVATMWFYFFNGCVHYAYGAYMREYGRFQPSSLILWSALVDGHEEGYRTLDLGRTRLGSGVFEFKRKWKGEIRKISVLHLGKDDGSSPFLDPINPRVSILSRLWRSLVPLPLTVKIGPLIRGLLAR